MPEAQPLALTKDLRFNLPPGLIGNPVPLPKCSLYVFTQQGQGRQSRMSREHGRWCRDADRRLNHRPHTLDIRTRSSERRCTALEPAVGEPARFGFQTPVGPVILDTSVRTGGDYGVVVTRPEHRRSAVHRQPGDVLGCSQPTRATTAARQ